MHIDYIDNVDGTQNDIQFGCGTGFTNHRKGSSLSQSVQEDTSAPDYLYNEALKWDNINPQFALDTMRLFVEREPHLMPLTEKGIQYTANFVAEMDTIDSAGKSWINSALWIEEYNWLASIYTLDTSKYYHVFVLTTMAASEIYFDRNGAANLWYNYILLYPDSMDIGLASREIASIRGYQATIPEDTTPFYRIPIPPLPYGADYVAPTIPGSVHIAAWPNPVKDALDINISSSFSAPVSLVLYDALGKTVRTLPVTRVSNGNNPMQFDLSDLPPGSYYLRLSANAHVQTLKLFKQ